MSKHGNEAVVRFYRRPGAQPPTALHHSQPLCPATLLVYRRDTGSGARPLYCHTTPRRIASRRSHSPLVLHSIACPPHTRASRLLSAPPQRKQPPSQVKFKDASNVADPSDKGKRSGDGGGDLSDQPIPAQKAPPEGPASPFLRPAFARSKATVGDADSGGGKPGNGRVVEKGEKEGGGEGPVSRQMSGGPRQGGSLSQSLPPSANLHRARSSDDCSSLGSSLSG